MKIKPFSFCLLFVLVFSPLSFGAQTTVGLSDEELLDEIQRKSIQFFLVEKDAETGLVRDRAHNSKRGATKAPSSIAATGFALTVYPIAVQHGWMDVGTAKAITERTLRFFLKEVEQQNGFFYHFLNMKTGQRVGRSELSPIDTALFLAGALFAAEYFEDPQIRQLAQAIYERVNWQWMLNEGETLALAWSPEDGFSRLHWDHYNESMIMYLLAIGSPTFPIPASSWDEIKRPVGTYEDYTLIQMPPLFTHQYSHIWIDFKNKHDQHADYFENSVNASKANRQFVMDHAHEYKSYGANSWGLTASDGPFGYKAYGASPGWAEHDGTIAPTGCGSSIVFTPKESMACLRYIYERLGDNMWGLYGFADSYNLDKDWFAHDVIGIDQGALISMIENYRTGFVWDVMAKNIYLESAMKRVGFEEGTMELKRPMPPSAEAPYLPGIIQVDGYLKDWPFGERIVLDLSSLESGTVESESDLSGEIRFAWDEQALYFYVKVYDDDILVRKKGKALWLDDLLELYIDPDGDGLEWYGADDYQIGVRAEEGGGGVEAWSWFQGGEDPQEMGALKGRSFVDQKGYLIEGMIRWDFLHIKPFGGQILKISPAIHDIDRDRQHAKLIWFMQSNGKYKQFELGDLHLQSPKGDDEKK